MVPTLLGSILEYGPKQHKRLRQLIQAHMLHQAVEMTEGQLEAALQCPPVALLLDALLA